MSICKCGHLAYCVQSSKLKCANHYRKKKMNCVCVVYAHMRMWAPGILGTILKIKVCKSLYKERKKVNCVCVVYEHMHTCGHLAYWVQSSMTIISLDVML